MPPPGEPSVGFPWRPVLEHLASPLGIGEPLTAGDPPLSQTGQLPCPLSWTSLRKAQWFNLCPTMDPFFKEMVEVVKEIAPTWCMWDMHTIMQWVCDAYQLKKPPCFKIHDGTPDNMRACCLYGSITQKVFPLPSDKRMTVHSTHQMGSRATTPM